MARKGYKTATFTLPDGSRKYVYAKTQEELDQKVFDLKLQMKMGVDLNDRTTVGELIKMWFETDILPKVQRSTSSGIRIAINTHLLPLCSNHIAKEVTPLQVKLWLNETSKLNKKSAATCFRALREAFNLAEENGLVYKSPVLARYKAGGKASVKKEALNKEEERLLLDAVSDSRAYLFVWFALATGARRGELCGLKWDMVNLDTGEVRLERNLVFYGNHETELHDYMKTASGKRTVPLPADLCTALRAEKARAKSLFVFTRPDGTPFTGTSFNVFWKLVTRRFGPEAQQTARINGIITDTRVTPHTLRHTYATRCFEAGMDIKEVQYLMGHASPSITLEIYTHYCESSRRDETFEKARAARCRTTSVPQAYHKTVSASSI